MDLYSQLITEIKNERGLQHVLNLWADGCHARLRIRAYMHGGEIDFFWMQKGRYNYDHREKLFTAPADEFIGKTREEICAAVERYFPGYINILERERTEQRRRQQIRVRRNNELISWKREQARKKITTCQAPRCKNSITAVRASKQFCSPACRQRARRRWS
jgi:hypothetical protein